MNLKNTQDIKVFDSVSTPAPVALVTGGARRIGAAIVQALHDVGYQVAIHCHASTKDAMLLAASLNALRANSAFVFQADLADPLQDDRLIDDVIAWAGSLAVLVNNASLFTRSDLSVANEHLYHELFAVNVFAPWRLSLKARPWLEASAGNIINLTDIHAESPLKQYAEYCQTKSALWMQTKALAKEFAPQIRVNAVAPGAILWPEASNVLSAGLKEKIIHDTPLQRHGEPRYVAEAVLSLLNNHFMTGQLLRVDGGRSI